MVHRLLHDEVEGVGIELEGNAIEFEEALVLLDEGVLRLGEDAAERVGIERVEVGQDGEAADELGDEPEAPEVCRGDGDSSVRPAFRAGVEADARCGVRRSMCCSMPLKAPPQTKRMLRVSSVMSFVQGACGPCGGTLTSALEELEQGLLDALRSRRG